MAREFRIPEKVFTGENSLELASQQIAQMGKRALIVSGKVMTKLGNVAKLEAVLDKVDVEHILYNDILGEPTDVMIEAGAKAYLKGGCDFLIALGGGSPLDSMKAIGILVAGEKKLTDYMGQMVDLPIPKMVAIPTTAGTGSEATQFTIITDSEKSVKMLLKGPCLLPDMAIVDSQFTVSASPEITANTGLDAFCHCTESYTSRKSQPIADTYALSAVRRLYHNLPLAFDNGENLEAREQLALGALEAGFSFNNSSVTVIHGMSRPIGAMYHIPHGLSNAMLLKVCYRNVLEGAYERFADLGRAIGVAEPEEENKIAAEKFLEATEKLVEDLKIPTLAEYGIDRDDFFANIDKMTHDAMESGSPQNTRKELKEEDIKEMYRQLWD